jgi:hypothetical protein
MDAGNAHRPVEMRARFVSFASARRLRLNGIQDLPLNGRKTEAFVC